MVEFFLSFYLQINIVRYLLSITGQVYHDTAEQLIVYVSVKMFYQQPVRESNVSLQYHKGTLCRRTETIPTSQAAV